MSHPNSDIIKWIKKAVGTENCLVEIEGKVGKGNGFVGDVICVKVNLKNNEKELNLIVKVSKVFAEGKRIMADLCKREVAFYSQIFPIFEQFQEEKNIAEPFNSVPKCYKAFLTESAEVIVQENMITRGYELHQSTIAMNMNHMKLVLKNYAKFHAISFALKDQRIDVFKKIEEICYDHMPGTINNFGSFYTKRETTVVQTLHEIGRVDLAQKYQKLVAKGSANILKGILEDRHEHTVVTHADCHNGNFLFEYKTGNKENPINVVFLDFQISSMLSPMIDLGLYFYAGASKEEFPHFIDLMEFYHKELSSFLFDLGSDVNELYPISAMWEDWKKYSLYGFITSTLFIELLFIDKENTPDGERDPNQEFSNCSFKNKSAYLERLTGIVEHYFGFLGL